MSRRVYIHSFLDVNGDYVNLEEEKDLKKIEWLVKENEHNIEIIKEKYISPKCLDKESTVNNRKVKQSRMDEIEIM